MKPVRPLLFVYPASFPLLGNKTLCFGGEECCFSPVQPCSSNGGFQL